MSSLDTRDPLDTLAVDAVPFPSAPRTPADTGINSDRLVELVLKMLHFNGEQTGAELARRMGVPFSVIQPAVDQLKASHLCEIVGGTLLGEASYRYRITGAGHDRADAFLRSNHYVGPVPVPIDQYHRYMTRFLEGTALDATRDRVRAAFRHLVLGDGLLDQLGPAINSGHSMFIYGPPGNGKTVIAQALGALLQGDIAIPRAVEVDGSIIRWFDPVRHQPRPAAEPAPSLETGATADQRWVRCRRPTITVGGELTLASFDLGLTASLGLYQAPVQAIANGGVLVIDDFGRQQCSPRDLLNRWIVPLESRVDFLTLRTGQSFDIPFQVFMVFATNTKPVELVDEAFLRRIHYKVFAESPSVEQFVQIFEGCCRSRDIPFDRSVVDRLLTDYYRPRRIELRGCQPRDLIDHALSLAEYLEAPRRLTPELLEQACAGYFVDDQETPPSYA